MDECIKYIDVVSSVLLAVVLLIIILWINNLRIRTKYEIALLHNQARQNLPGHLFKTFGLRTIRRADIPDNSGD